MDFREMYINLVTAFEQSGATGARPEFPDTIRMAEF